jgi:hypothetical protein
MRVSDEASLKNTKTKIMDLRFSALPVELVARSLEWLNPSHLAQARSINRKFYSAVACFLDMELSAQVSLGAWTPSDSVQSRRLLLVNGPSLSPGVRQEVRQVNFEEGHRVRAPEWTLLAAHFTAIEKIHCPSSLSDGGLAELCNLPSLTELHLKDCDRITDVGMRNIGNRIRLRLLNVGWCTRITPVRKLPVLDSLTSLDFTCCEKITDAALGEVAKLTKLTSLSLSSCTRITDEGLRKIAPTLSALTALDLSQCDRVTDKGMQHVAKLLRLKSLDLCEVNKSPILVCYRLPHCATSSLSTWLGV